MTGSVPYFTHSVMYLSLTKRAIAKVYACLLQSSVVISFVISVQFIVMKNRKLSKRNVVLVFLLTFL
jgi:hypothetical protein